MNGELDFEESLRERVRLLAGLDASCLDEVYEAICEAAKMIVAEASYEVADPTIDSQVLKIKDSGADLFYSASTPKQAAQAIRKIHELNWKPVHILDINAISHPVKKRQKRLVDLLTDGPYNTYLRAGLPPTPISMPGLASLRAAVNPDPTRALYFVSRGDGRRPSTPASASLVSLARELQVAAAETSSTAIRCECFRLDPGGGRLNPG